MAINNYTQGELLEICDDLYDQLIKKYSIYVTYLLYQDGGVKPVHCNYIERIDSDTYEDVSINVKFPSNGFRFLENINGYSADTLSILINVVENEEVGDVYKRIEPKSNKWKKYDVGVVTVSDLKNNTFTQSLSDYDIKEDYYDLDHLNYPKRGEDKLSFGEEVFFLGNVETDIEAIVHSTDLTIKLPLNDYNFTTNKTWDGDSSIYITEIGIYDDEDNLVAIGKFSEPLEKNQNISRNIVFAIDF